MQDTETAVAVGVANADVQRDQITRLNELLTASNLRAAGLEDEIVELKKQIDHLENIRENWEAHQDDVEKTRDQSEVENAEQMARMNQAMMNIAADQALRTQIEEVQKSERSRVRMLVSGVGLACCEGSEARRTCEQIANLIDVLGVKIEPAPKNGAASDARLAA